MATPNDRFNVLISNIQGIANDLLEFQPYVPNAATIPALVAELYAISSSLQELNVVSDNPWNVYDTIFYADAKRAVVEALRRTLQDLDRYIKKKDRRSNRSRREIYSSIWADLNDFFYEQSRSILFDRLHCFKLFLQELVLVLKGDRESLDFDLHYQRINKLLDLQDEDLSQELRRLKRLRDAIAVPPKVKSWERIRPEDDKPRTRSPLVAPQPPAATAGIPRHHPASPVSPSGPGRIWELPPDPNRPPSPPTSTTSSKSPSAGSSPSCIVPNMAKHWLMTAFAQDRPTTRFVDTSAESALFGKHMPGVKDQLRKNEYEELLILRFDNNVVIKIYIRKRDHKARIYCKMGQIGKMGKMEKGTVSCRPITKLYIRRQDSNLQLYEIDEEKRYRMWLILRFPSYERMVLLFCAFLALKRDDKSLPDYIPHDHILPEEKHVFSCSIYDKHFRHALQIFKDESSGGIRLQASIIRGEQKTTPVWTAFINYKISSIRWIRRVESRKIHLADLPRYVFINDYTPHMGPNGEYELQFDEAGDADRFAQIIEDLAEGRA